MFVVGIFSGILDVICMCCFCTFPRSDEPYIFQCSQEDLYVFFTNTGILFWLFTVTDQVVLFNFIIYSNITDRTSPN